MVTPTVLIVPGLGGSGPDHWQSLWLDENPAWRRVEQRDWDRPVASEWLAALDEAVALAPGPVVLVAHSLSCALVVRWAETSARAGRVTGALLVSPADVDSPDHTPEEARVFAPMPTLVLPFRTLVVASDDDPYVAPERAAGFAAAWGADLTLIPGAGHINADSGFGPWPLGQDLLRELMEDL
ncbi:alpha/beta hydrolase [Tistrella mobilis]|uniref:RBBP9/YdeN family alpha/beta hydrolase n=1 Tax=Tistrella mobilis TaxID=171437 RepID=UPI0035569B7C